MRRGPPAAFCPLCVCLSVSNETLLFAEKSSIFAPGKDLLPPFRSPFGDFRTNGSLVEQFCNRCAHRFFRFDANVIFRARLAVLRNRHFAARIAPKVLKRGGPPIPLRPSLATADAGKVTKYSILHLLEWGGWQARTRDEDFPRGGGAGFSVLSSVCVSAFKSYSSKSEKTPPRPKEVH